MRQRREKTTNDVIINFCSKHLLLNISSQHFSSSHGMISHHHKHQDRHVTSSSSPDPMTPAADGVVIPITGLSPFLTLGSGGNECLM